MTFATSIRAIALAWVCVAILCLSMQSSAAQPATEQEKSRRHYA
jgi:hypothetical protein